MHPIQGKDAEICLFVQGGPNGESILAENDGFWLG